MDARGLSVGFFCLLLIVTCAFIASADPLDTWHWINPQPQGNSLNSVIFGNDLFVAFGDTGGIITSPDGESWTPRATGTVKALHGSIFGNGMFVAVGEGGTIVTSPDGMSWTNRPSVADSLLRGVAAGNGLFVAVGDQGTIVTSPDGVTWTRQESGTSNRLSAATFGNGVFVVAAESAFLTSQDGVTWTRVAVGDADIFSTVAFGNGLFVASEIARPDFSCLFIPCYPQDKQIYVSTDGARWRAVGEKRYSTPASEALTFDNGLFIGSSNQSIDFYGVLGISTSADGVTWTPVSDLSPSGIVRGDAVFVAVRDRDIFTSPDLANWTLRTRYTVPDVSGDGSRVLSAGGMLFITFPAADEILVVRSVSTGTLVRDVTLFDVAFGNGIFGGVGGSGLSTSFDGLTWTLNVPGGDLSGIAYGNGSFVAVGSAGVSFTSPDGMSWAPRWSGTFHGFRGVRFGNGLFVALRDDNTIVTSVDGAAWTLRAAGLPGFELLDLFFDNGVFAVIGADRSAISMAADFIFMTSSDGISWRTVRAPDDVGPSARWLSEPNVSGRRRQGQGPMGQDTGVYRRHAMDSQNIPYRSRSYKRRLQRQRVFHCGKQGDNPVRSPLYP